MRPRIEGIVRFNTTMSETDSNLLKEFGGASFIRSCIAIEKARRVQKKAIETAFLAIKQNGWAFEDKDERTVEFSAFGEHYRAKFTLGRTKTDSDSLTPSQEDQRVYKALIGTKFSIQKI